MEQNIRKVLEKPLLEKNIVIDSITYEKENLNIILDSSDTLDLDKIVEASKLINDILDKEDFIKDKYLLDISSKEKGEVK